MKFPVASVIIGSLAYDAQAATFTIETCQDLVSAAESTASEDTVATIDPSASIDCGGSYETLEIRNNELTVEASDDTSSSSDIQLVGLRIDVSDSGQLKWGPKVIFSGLGDEVTLVSTDPVSSRHRTVVHSYVWGILDQASRGRVHVLLTLVSRSYTTLAGFSMLIAGATCGYYIHVKDQHFTGTPVMFARSVKLHSSSTSPHVA